jgi:hypothetical protein
MGRAHTLKGLRVDEVSLVDAPANPGALHVLFKRRNPTVMVDYDDIIKRSFTADQRKDLAASGAALPDGSFPIENTADLHNAIKAVGRAADPEKAKAHIKSRARALGAADALPDAWKAAKADGPLDRLLTRLGLRKAQADALDPDAYADAAAASVDQATTALGKSIASILADTAVADKATAIGKSLAEFRDFLGDAMPQQIEKAMRDVALAGVTIEQKDNTMPTLDEVVATNADLHKRLAAAELEITKAKMSAKHKAFHDKLKTDDAKGKFLAKSPEDRDAQMDAAEPDDGDDDTAKRLTKALGETADLRKRLEAFEAEREVITFQKRAKEIGLADAQAETILKASKGDGTAFQAVLDMIKAANAQAKAGAVFKEFGGSGGLPPTGGQAQAEVTAQAETLRKADPKLSLIAARVAVRKANPDLAQRERDEERAAVRAVT